MLLLAVFPLRRYFMRGSADHLGRTDLLAGCTRATLGIALLVAPWNRAVAGSFLVIAAGLAVRVLVVRNHRRIDHGEGP